MSSAMDQSTAPATNPQTAAHGGPIDHADLEEWKNRFNAALSNTATVSAPAAHDARPWSQSLFGCFAPIDLCAITCCLPCVTFGKTHHRVRKNGSLQGYEPINTSCLLFTGFSCFGLHWIPAFLQRVDIRQKHNLQGDCLTDLLASCCCACCSLIQQEKESEVREKELSNKAGEGYAKTDGMAYPA